MPRDQEDDYYAVLGLATDVEEDEIRRTWRRLALTWHPDRAGPGTTHAFARMSVAYAVISDPASRAAYDKRRGIERPAKVTDRGSSPSMRNNEARSSSTGDDRHGTSDTTPRDGRTAGDTTTRDGRSASDTATRDGGNPSTASDAPIGKRAPGVLLTRISGPLNILMARGVVREHGDSYELMLDDEEARDGGMVTISMRVLVKCPTCDGSGTGSDRLACTSCHGDRVVEDLFAAWLAVRPGVADGTVLMPSANLPNMLKPVAFRVRLPA